MHKIERRLGCPSKRAMLYLQFTDLQERENWVRRNGSKGWEGKETKQRGKH
jgi:hypothetical protein